jgi:hypothetical protein
MPVREEPTKQAQYRSLAPAVRRTPALKRSHTFHEATDDGEQEVDRSATDENKPNLVAGRDA